MTAIAFDYPQEIAALREGIMAFIRAEVIPRHEKNQDLLSDPRRKYTARGAFTPEVLDLIREVRMAAAKAGYYAMCVPAEIGGGGLGYLAYFVAWEQRSHARADRQAHARRRPGSVSSSMSEFAVHESSRVVRGPDTRGGRLRARVILGATSRRSQP